MKRKTLCTLIFACTIFYSNAQVSEAAKNMQQQANAMADVFINSDYKTYAKYIHPVIVKGFGGATKMSEILSKSMADLKAKGMTITKITFDAPGTILKSGKELQAIITEHLEMKIPNGRAEKASSFIGISSDNGLHWVFIETSNMETTALRQNFPNLSKSLQIPPVQKPVYYKD